MSDLNDVNKMLRENGLPEIVGSNAIPASFGFVTGSELASLYRIGLQQAWYQEQILHLVAVLWPQPLAEVDRLFKKWYQSTVFPLRFAMDHCLDRAHRGLSMPWEKAATPSGSEANSGGDVETPG